MFSIILSFISSCKQSDIPLNAGDDYKIAWAYFKENAIFPLSCLNFLLFETDNKSVVIKRTDDYRLIEKIKAFPSVSVTSAASSVYVKGWDVFQVVEHFGLPSYISQSLATFYYNPEDGGRLSIAFLSDSTHLYDAL